MGMPSSPPSVRPSPRVTGLLLAAGQGRRYGRPKALVDEGQGLWVVRAAQALLDGGCGDVLVVTGAAADQVEEELADLADPRVSTTRCGTWEQGMGESLRAGLATLATRGRTMPAQALVHLVDLPDVGPEVVARLLAARPAGAGGVGGDALVRAAYRGVPGHPVLLGQDHWQAVLDVARGDAGARAYLRRARPELVECGDLATGADVDVPLPSLLAFDMDGTLLGPHHEPLPSSVAAIAAARERGVRVALASGRDPHSLRLLAERAGMDLDGLLLVGRNGSVVVEAGAGAEVWSEPLPRDLLTRAVTHAAAYPVSVSVPAGRHLYVTDPDAPYVQTEARHNEQEVVVLESLAAVPVPVTKVLTAAPPELLVELADQIAAPFREEMTWVFSAPFYFEGTLLGVDKGTALQRVCEQEGLDLARTVAFGDQANDVGMLRTAGLGVAMGNAVPAAQQAADVVIGDHGTDAIAELLRERFGIDAA